MAQNIDVSIIPQSYLPEIKVSENDNSLRVIRVSIVDENGEAYQIPSGVTATFAGTKPSGLGFTVPCTIDGSVVQFVMEDTVCNEAGRFPAEIRLINGEARIGTCNVLMSVEPNPHPDDTTDGDREPLVNEITALLQQITEQADRVEADADRAQQAAEDAAQSEAKAEQAKQEWENMSATATTLPSGSSATASYSEGVLSLGIPAGATGPKGDPGQDGQDGVGIASTVLNDDYTLTITLTDGTTYTTTSIRGEQGETGLTPDFAIGTVTTLAPGSQATATITGTDEEPVLNLGIPKGDPGDVSSTGYYPDLYAGGLATDKGETDVSPYTFRASKALGYRESLNQIVGATVGWNQLVENGDFSSGLSGWTASGATASVSSGEVTLTATGSNVYFYRQIAQKVTGHKVFIAFYVSASRSMTMSVFWGDALKYNITIGTTKSRVSFVANVGGGNNNLNFGFLTNSGDEVRVSYVILADITSAFGTSIADYAYTLEQSTAGSGIAWLKSYGFLTKDYYEYCQPRLESVRVSAHVMRDTDDNIIGNYPLDSTLTLNGILKLSGDEITADGDVYGCDGTVTRNTIVRAYQSGDESLANAITDKTNTVVYSANASTETADGYTQIQFCDPDGTEAFVDYGVESGDRDVAIPVGHSTFYPEDLKGKLEDIPDIPEAPASNGTYTLKAVRSNSGVTYSWVSG